MPGVFCVCLVGSGNEIMFFPCFAKGVGCAQGTVKALTDRLQFVCGSGPCDRGVIYGVVYELS